MARLTLVAACLFTFRATPVAAQTADFSGEWETTFGPLTLVQDGETVHGEYEVDGQQSTLEGTVEDDVLNFEYSEGTIDGIGRIQLSADGQSFNGRWREVGQVEWGAWNGTRVAAPTFAGLWETTFGRMRLVAADDRIHGIYAYGAGSTIDGTLEDQRLTFQYEEPEAAGEGWFELSDDGQGFSGQWREAGIEGWSSWEGGRIQPERGREWLVVLEARWEADLAEREYSFGSMLRSFFARVPHVEVRHRFFDNAESLRHWSSEVAYLAEPVVVVIASHGDDDGVSVNGTTVNAEELAECFSYAGTTQLVHFSACRIMAGDTPEQMQDILGPRGIEIPLSGYETNVDWASSAVIEFMYLEMILSYGLDPEEAAEQVLKLVPISGDEPIPDAILPPAGFRLLSPSTVEGELRQAA